MDDLRLGDRLLLRNKKLLLRAIEITDHCVQLSLCVHHSRRLVFVFVRARGGVPQPRLLAVQELDVSRRNAPTRPVLFRKPPVPPPLENEQNIALLERELERLARAEGVQRPGVRCHACRRLRALRQIAAASPRT
eukprot:Amastigsp_a2913_27.p2 type:complete len:135 gc:universal Amastigsp_a2913_27:283-687(+)